MLVVNWAGKVYHIIRKIDNILYRASQGHSIVHLSIKFSSPGPVGTTILILQKINLHLYVLYVIIYILI